MKQQIVPTSPKSPDMQKRRKHKEQQAEERAAHLEAHPHLMFAVIVSSLVFGLLAGVFGFMIALNVPSDWPVIGQLNIVEYMERQRTNVLLSVRQRENSLVQQAPSVVNHVVPVYASAPTVETPSSLLVNAVVLTSDGWMVAPATAGFVENSETAVVVLPDGTSASVEEVVVDSVTAMAFFQIDVNGVNTALSPVVFSGAQSLRTGQTVALLEQQIGSYIVYEHRVAGERDRSQEPRSTDVAAYRIALDGDIQVGPGAGAFAGNGELHGIVDGELQVVPAAYIEGVLGQLESVTVGETVTRTNWTMEYINLARLTDEEKEEKGYPEEGLLLTAVDEGEPVIGGIVGVDEEGESIVDKALMVNDVILSVNNQLIDSSDDLGIILHSHEVGETLYMQTVRDGETRSISIEL